MIWPLGKIRPHIASLGLAQQFVLAAGITIAASMGLLALAISHRIEASMMQTAAEEGALFTEVVLGPVAQELATSRTLSPESVKRIDDLLAGRLGERLKLIKIWLPDATLVYSTNKEAIGGRFPSSPITAAFKGKVTGEFDYLDAVENATARRLQVPLVEIYAPLFRTGTKEVIAVGEIYTDGRRLAGDLGFDPVRIRRDRRCRHRANDADIVLDGSSCRKPGQDPSSIPPAKCGRGDKPRGAE